jgi:hypothetical protein
VSKKRLSLDFDGVLHSYISGYVRGREDEVIDPPTPGAIEALTGYVKRFEVHIHSTRCARPAAVLAMKAWLLAYGLPPEVLAEIRFSAEKVPGWLHLDDRAWLFTGRWPSAEEIDAFRPWYKQAAPKDEAEQLRAELARVKAAVAKHQAQQGDDRCWRDDAELYREVLGEESWPHESMPPEGEFLANCRRYYRACLTGQPYRPEHTLTRAQAALRQIRDLVEPCGDSASAELYGIAVRGLGESEK